MYKLEENFLKSLMNQSCKRYFKNTDPEGRSSLAFSQIGLLLIIEYKCGIIDNTIFETFMKNLVYLPCFATWIF